MTAFSADKRIFFGHQSVGNNILDGIQAIAPSMNVVAHTDEGLDTTDPGLYHRAIGQNRDPYSKIDDFDRLVKTTFAEFDIVMMKLCYVDITRETDIAPLFQHYASMADDLSTRLPHLRIIHLTVPLRCIRLGIRSRLRQLTGTTPVVVDDNAQREAYNALLQSRYANSDCFFDLAEIESTKPDGNTSSIRSRNQVIRTLYSGYSDDGGHLNSKGSRIVARQLLELVTEP